MSVKRRDRDHLAVVVLDRPDRRNALDIPMLDALCQELESVERERPAGLVLMAEGPAFCAGLDGDVLKTLIGPHSDHALVEVLDRLDALVRLLAEVQVPTIAALAGPAIGPGATLALACDLRVAAPTASLLAGFFRFGGSPDGGLSVQLVRAFGYHRALHLSLTDDRVDAEELARLGLVATIVPPDMLLDSAVQLGRAVSGRPPAAMPRLRRVLASAAVQSLPEQLSVERAAAKEAVADPALRSALAAWGAA